MAIKQSDIDFIEDFFAENFPPEEAVQLLPEAKLVNPMQMIETHISICRTYIKQKRPEHIIKPYYDRLVLIGKLTKEINNG